MWRINELVVAVLVTLTAVVLHELANNGALWMPHCESTAKFRWERQQVKFVSKLAMVALPCLFKTMQVFFQCNFAFPRGSVDALQHGAFFVASPIRTGNFHEGKVTKSRSGRHVRATTQIDKLIGVAIHADGVGVTHFTGIAAVGGTRGDALNDFALVLL